MACDFVNELSKLRKQSAESVDNITSFEGFKKYLHVERKVEEELRCLLRKVNEKPHKCLVLLCGSAGDGKSHLISYLKNSDNEHLLEDFEPYNDATESSAPDKTAIETLAEKLYAFRDDQISMPGGKKMIVAINLGMLNNFIESEQGKAYSCLKEFIERKSVFSNHYEMIEYDENSVFQVVSFSDYQIFSLHEDGVGTDFLERLFEKIFAESDDNPFYKSFKKNSSCPLCSLCPVRHNFQFLSSKENQSAVIEKIVEVIIKDKMIISTREVLNLLYDILVHPHFSKKSFAKLVSSKVAFLENYISSTTPMLLNETDGVSDVLRAFKDHNYLQERSAEMDADALEYYSINNSSKLYSDATENTTYHEILQSFDLAQLVKSKVSLRSDLFRFIVYINQMRGKTHITEEQNRFKKYLNFLYYKYSGRESSIKQLYELTSKAILTWNGKFDTDYICIDETNDNYWIMEKLSLRPYPIPISISEDIQDVQRFTPVIKLRFMADDDVNKSASVNIDFTLYSMLCDINQGYRPTVKDENTHVDFLSFVQHFFEFGEKDRRITLIPKYGIDNKKIVFEESVFSDRFEFRVD